MNYKWTDDKIALLKQYYPTASWEDLFAILGTTKKSSIISMASHYGISRTIYNDCHASDTERQFIKDHADTMTASDIARALNRNVTFVCRCLKALGLEPMNRGVKPEDVESFKELYPIYTNKYLSEKFFPYLSPQQMRCQAKKFKLEKTKDKSIKWYDKEDLLDKLEKVIKKLGRIPLLREFEELGLPSEATFRRYFGSVTGACQLIGVERLPYNTLSDVSYDSKGNLCLSQCELEISNFLIQHNIEFKKEVMYSSLMSDPLCGQKRFDWTIGNKCIEYFGLMHHEEYKANALIKINLCHKHNVPLLELYAKDFNKDHIWEKKILEFLQ